jgi:integrase
VKTKGEAKRVEAVILHACRSGDYSGLDSMSREACIRMFQNQGWELPPEFSDVASPDEELTLWRAVEICLKYPEVLNSPNRPRHKQAFVHLGAKLGKNFPVKSIWIPQIKQYQVDRLGEGAAASTINKERAALSKMFQVLIELRYLDVNPVKLVKPLSEKSAKRQVYISDLDFSRILDRLPEWYRPIAQTAHYTGMRRGEVLGLTWRRVNLKTRMIYLGPDEVKEKDWKRVPIHKELVPILESLRSQQIVGLGRLFVHSGVPVTHKDQVRWVWERSVAKVQGLDSTLRFHDLRHTWKTNARRSGMDPEIRESIMGHALRCKSISEGYGRISDEELVKAVDLMTFAHGDTEVWVTQKKKKPTAKNRQPKNSNSLVTERLILQSQVL